MIDGPQAQVVSDLLDENDSLRDALTYLLVNVREDVPAEIMSDALVDALATAEELLADMGDIDYEEEE